MSILETFYLLFKTKGSEEASKDAEKVTKAFLNMGSAITNVVAAAFSVNKLFDGLKNANNYTLELAQASRLLNVNVSDLDAWGQAVTKAGGSAAGLQSSLRSLAQTFGTSGKVALQALPHFADTFSKLNQAQAFRYGNMLGIDEGTVMFLQRGRREVEAAIKVQKELGTVQKEDTEIAFHFKNQLQDTAQVFRYAFMEANRTIVPILDNLAQKMQYVGEFFVRHSDIIVGTLGAIGIAAAGAAVSFGVLTSPITLATAAIVALGAAYDDLMTYFKGGKSITGDIIKQFERLEHFFEPLAKSLGGTLFASKQKYDAFHEQGQAEAAVMRGQQMLGEVAAADIGVHTSQSILDRSIGNVSTVFSGDIIVNTQATDPEGVADAVHRSLQSYNWQLGANHDDGVFA